MKVEDKNVMACKSDEVSRLMPSVGYSVYTYNDVKLLQNIEKTK